MHQIYFFPKHHWNDSKEYFTLKDKLNMIKERIQQQQILETGSFCLTCQNQKLNPKPAVEKA